MEPIPEIRNEGEPDKQDGNRGKNVNQGDKSKSWDETPGEWQEYIPQSSNEKVQNFNFKD